MLKAKRKHHVFIKFLAVVLIIAGIALLIDIRVRPIIEQTAIYQSKILATRIINDAVYSQLDDEQFNYSGLITLIYNNEKQISAIESNMVNINKLKAKINNSINERLCDLDSHDLSIALGTVSGFSSFYNQGPLIPVKVKPDGFVETNLISSFKDAGINQTLHRILVRIKVNISAIIPGYTSSGVIDTEFVIAETVIVGNVPEAYTHVISGDEDIIGDINDYGASEGYNF